MSSWTKKAEFIYNLKDLNSSNHLHTVALKIQHTPVKIVDFCDVKKIFKKNEKDKTSENSLK